MYRFSIYKYHVPEGIPTGSTTRISDRKYLTSFYEFEAWVNPVYSDLVLQVLKERERKFFRWKISGTMMFKDEDYDLINGIRLDSKEHCKARYMLIEQKQDGVWVEIFKGFLKVEQGVYKNCQVTFDEFDVFDRYSEILTKMKLEYNMVLLSSATAYIPVVTYNYDWDDIEYLHAGDGIPVNDDCPDVPPAIPTTLDGKWTLVICHYPKGGFPSITQSIIGHYRRDWQWASVQPDAEWEDTGEPSPYNPLITKWVRNYRGQTTPTYYVYQGTYGFNNIIHCNYNLNTDDIAVGENTRGKRFNTVIETLLSRISSIEDSFVSQFFSNKALTTIPNPVTGDVFNFYGTLLLYQKSDLKANSDPATEGMVALENIEQWIKVVFNSFWHIDDNGNFVIEHQKYFDGSFSYLNNKVIGLIITDESVKNKTGFSYISENIPRYEKFTCMDKQDQAFNGLSIEYDSHCATEDEDIIELEHTTENLTLDLRYVISNEERIADGGFFLLAIEAVATPFYRFEPKYEENLYTNESLPNGDLAYPNLQHNLFRHNGFLPEAYINDVKEDFFSWKKYQLQEDISIQLCNLSEFDPYKLVQTVMGDGEVVEANYQLKTQVLTLKLKYDG